jgi:hypothetical protein
MGTARNLANFKPSSAGLAGVEDLDTSATQLFGSRNRIINGSMVISQRNGTTAVACTNQASTFGVDRFSVYRDNSSATVTIGQSSNAPTGFVNSSIFSVTTGSTPTAANEGQFRHIIEGYNVADFGFGTASPQPATLSFWVRSSLTGTFAVAFQNTGSGLAYVTTYTISSANTWEQKSVTFTGPTTGTWNTTNGSGLVFIWDLGGGSNFNATPNTWTAGNVYTTSGTTKVMGTTGATWQITGVQFERGSVATPYEYRDVQSELARCQRYFERSDGNQQVVGGAPTGFGNNTYGSFTHFLVQKRATPTIVAIDMVGNTGRMSWWQGTVQYNNQTFGPETLNTMGFSADTTAGRTDAGLGRFTWTASAEL